MSMNHSLAVKVLAFRLQVIIYNTYGFVFCFFLFFTLINIYLNYHKVIVITQLNLYIFKMIKNENIQWFDLK